MKIFLLATNYIGYQITKYLVKKNDNIVGLGLISENNYTCKIIEASSPHFNDRVRVESLFGIKDDGGLPSTKKDKVLFI